MKKRMSLIVCVLAASLSFAGCSQKADTEYDESAAQQITETLITSFSQMGKEGFEQFRSLSDYQLDYTMMQSGLPIEGDNFLSMLDAWEGAEKECGSYVKHGEYEFEASDKELSVSTLAEYEDRDATIEIKFDEDLNLESMDVSAKYTTAEILEKAGLNTVLGMGTVFVVLIFLAFLISLIKYIPPFVEKFTKKSPQPVQTATPVVAETAEEDTEYVDDLELVAVITAAIAAQTGTSTDGFVVRSIRRRPSNNWN